MKAIFHLFRPRKIKIQTLQFEEKETVPELYYFYPDFESCLQTFNENSFSL